MKKNIVTLFLVLFFISSFSQNTKFEYGRRRLPVIKKEKLNDARFINQIMPEFSRYFSLPYNERVRMDDLLKLVDPAHLTYALGNCIHLQEDYEKIIDYVSIEILVFNQGKVVTAKSTDDVLTIEQKNILKAADLSSDIRVKIKFNYKNWLKGNDTNPKTKEGSYLVTVIPETEAVYPGGITAYLTGNLIDKILETSAYKKLQQAIVEFTVNEEGRVINAKMKKTSTDLQIDRLILDVINKMSKWIPAADSRGISVKEKISIQFSGGGC